MFQTEMNSRPETDCTGTNIEAEVEPMVKAFLVHLHINHTYEFLWNMTYIKKILLTCVAKDRVFFVYDIEDNFSTYVPLRAKVVGRADISSTVGHTS